MIRWAGALLVLICTCSLATSKSQPMQFTGSDAMLQNAIDADDAEATKAALAAGAHVDARGAHGVTPLEYAVGTFRRQAATALIHAHANPNLKDDEGDGAVSMAVGGYKRDSALLEMVLAAGGDPNASRPDGNPVIVRFLNDANLDAITFLHAHGADIDAKVKGEPMVVTYAISEDWDVVWRLIQLGAHTDTPRLREGLEFAFRGPEITQPDSPLYPAKVAVWHRLRAQGMNLIPPARM